MLLKLLFAWALIATTVIIHAIGLSIVLGPVLGSPAPPDVRFWPMARLLIRTAWWLVVIHLLEISVWGIFYWSRECLPDIESSFYFSGVTYTTIGYGDIVLPLGWRLFAPIEGMLGILMTGLSTGFFFALVSKIRGSVSVSNRR